MVEPAALWYFQATWRGEAIERLSWQKSVLKRLGSKADIMTFDSLLKVLRPAMEFSAVRVFQGCSVLNTVRAWRG